MRPFSWPGLGLCGLRHRTGALPVIALHGWLDNAQSFVPLAEHLDDLDLVALEFPGHGLSKPRPDGLRYHFDDYVFDVLAAADHLGWGRFHLLGHSLGGAVSTLLAAACPDRVQSMVLIEGLGPITAPSDQATAGWRRALRGSHSRPRRIHPDRESAVAARARHSDLDLASAELLARRGLSEREGGLVWHHDPRLTWPSTQRYTEAQVLDLLAHIECPVLNLQSDPPSGLLPLGRMQRRFAALKTGQRVAHPGGHHLHMHHPDRLAPAIQEFLHANALHAESHPA